MPAAPLQPVCLENGLDHTVGKVVQIQRPAYRIRKHPTGRILGLDGIEHKSKRLDDRNYAGVIVILVGLGLVFKMSPPDRTADAQNGPIVVVPPLTWNFALAQTSERRHSNCRPDNTLSNLGSVRAVLGQNDKSLSAGEELKVLFHFPKRIGESFPPMPLAFGDRDPGHWVDTLVDALTFGKSEHRRKRYLDVLISSVGQVVSFRLVRGFDFTHQVFTVHRPEVPDATDDTILDVTTPRILVPLYRRARQLPRDRWGVNLLEEFHDCDPRARRFRRAVHSIHEFCGERHDFALLWEIPLARQTP